MSNLSTYIPMKREEILPEKKVWKRREMAVMTPLAAVVCGLYMTGLNHLEIAKRVKKTPALVSWILQSKLAEQECERLKGILDRNFLTLQAKFNRVIDEALEHPDPSIALAGANLWAKAAGKFQSNSTNIVINNQIAPVDLSAYRKEVRVDKISK